MEDPDSKEIHQEEETGEMPLNIAITDISNNGEVTIDYSKPVMQRSVVNDLPKGIINVEYICNEKDC